MKKFILAASAAAFAISMPVAAENPGKGSSAKAQHSQSAKAKNKPHRDVRIDTRSRADARIDWRDVDRDDRRFDRERYTDRVQSRQSARDCPPGLAKKTPACIPPGQAKRLFNEGQRVPYGYDYFSRYDQIPERYRTRIPYSQNSRYIYRDDRVYVVDPATRLVTSIIDLFR